MDLEKKKTKPKETFVPLIRIDHLAPARDTAKEIAHVTLLLLGTGIVFTSTLLAPQATGLIAKMIFGWRQKRWRPYRVINYLKNHRWIKIQEKHGQSVIVLTSAGKRMSQRLSLSRMQIRQLHRWDKKWRIVSFDIPERHRDARGALRRQLRDLGFRQIQKSVWIVPWPCRDEIDYLMTMYDLRPYLLFLEVQDNEDFHALYRFFNLQE